MFEKNKTNHTKIKGKNKVGHIIIRKKQPPTQERITNKIPQVEQTCIANRGGNKEEITKHK